MNIPRYWARSETPAAGPAKEYAISSWAGSDVSLEDARAKAAARAAQIAQKVARGEPLGRYGYADRPLREEIKTTVQNRSREEVGIVTRNPYGALVLNAVGAMFIDIDIPGMDKPKKAGLFGGKKATFHPDPYLPAVRDVEAWAGRHPEYGLRIYATFAGLRCLIVNTVVDPKSGQASEIMRELKSDPLYQKLCLAQECFRARLTPKPWRCGMTGPSALLRYPRENPRREEEFRRWEKQYETAASQFATCSLVKQIGALHVHTDVEPILELHDRATRVESGLPLA
ncbi:MAG: hypothetical protein JW929_08070 [Anaerolineales bacterium]|nr:hypothetical protein [Anaerolineales bacterium]